MSMPPGWSNEFALSDYVLNPSAYRGGIFGIGGLNGILYGLDNEINHLRAYNDCPPLKSIVAKRAKAFNVAHIDVINKNTDKPATGPSAAAFRAILDRPNPLQTRKQFFAQQNIYIDIFGYCPVFIIRPFGVPDAVTAIWNIPPWLFNITYTGQWLMQSSVDGIFKGYTLQWSTGAVNLPTENLKLLFDDGFGTDMDINLTIPDSRLRSQEYPIFNIIAGLKARNTGITRGGPIGILSNEGVDAVGQIAIPKSEKDAVQKDFSRYGVVGQEYTVIITEANLKWQAMGSNLKDMQLYDEQDANINSLCDAFGYYPELLATSKSATFVNKEKAEKMFYTGTVIPESESRLEQFSNAIIGYGNNLCYQASFAHVPALQAEALETAQARKEMDTACEKEFKNNLITLNMWLDALELPPRAAEGDLYYNDLIKLGYEFGNTGISGGDVNPTTPPNIGLPAAGA